jgi:hypothetical protein
VQVKACGMVPNLGNVLANWPKWFPHLPLPKLPAIFGLDPAGVVVEVGNQVIGVKPGQRVYVNPLRSCGACQMCQAGEGNRCRYFTFNGYFGFGPDAQKIYDLYPYGGFCEFMACAQAEGGIIFFFLAGQGSAPGTNQHTTGGQSMSALPRYIRRQLAPLSRSRHRPQYPDNGRCSRSLCGRARAGRPEDCLCADRSALPSSA